MIIIKNPEEIQKMRKAGQLVAGILMLLSKAVKPGVTTRQLNALAEEQCIRHRAIPVFKNYPNPKGGIPFPGVICASVNEEVVHGIPGKRILKEGDIISIDFGASLQGYVGDSAITVPVGDVSAEVLKLIKITEEALSMGIQQAQPGNRLGMVSNTVQTHVETHGFSVVRDYVGHGIGSKMHEDPQVPNFGKANSGPELKPGMTLAIEPMINIGTFNVTTKPDKWTVVTADASVSAHFEHTIAIGDKGPEVLTNRD